MSLPPILRCADWPALIAALAGQPAWRSMDGLNTQLASAVLSAPAAIARSIALRAPQLAQRDVLSVLVIGAESVDAVDRGRWYQSIAPMLDAECRIDVTLVGASLAQDFASAASNVAPAVAANCACGGLAEYLDAHPQAAFDVAVLFQPGFQKYRGWLQDNCFRRLLDAGTLLIGSSNAPDEYQMERWVLDCHGYQASEQALDNPFYLELGDAQSSIRWGGVLWQIESAPAPEFIVNQTGLDALDMLTRMVMHSMAVVGRPAPAAGSEVELKAGSNQRKTVIHLFDLRFVDPADGRLLQLLENGVLAPIGQLPAGERAAYPGGAARDIERAMWAAGIKSRYLLGGYPAPEKITDDAALARAMFEQMRERAASLFR
jgi:hypothetical protein